MITIIMYLLGLFLCIIGAFFIFINLNLLVIGSSYLDYFKFIFSNIECLLFFIGIIILIVVYERG